MLLIAAIAVIAYGILSRVDGPVTVRGQVVSVERASVTTISSLTIEDRAGKRWTFQGGGTFAGFTPSHLEEHRALREQVTVEYEDSGSGFLKILGITD